MALRAPVPAAAAAGDDTCTNQIHTQQVNSTETQQSHARMEYVMQMRRMFSPPGAVCPDGSINQEFFQPKKVLTLMDKRWGDAEQEQLYKGLEQFGVGRWREMREQLLPGWEEQHIRLKAAKLLGCQNLSQYAGKQLAKAKVQDEYEKNKALGAATGCWKNGMLVDDNNGTLHARFSEQQQQQQQQQSSSAPTLV